MYDRNPKQQTVRLAPLRHAFSMVELLIVLSIIGILAALAVPYLNPSMQSQLESAGHIVAADLAYARSLAIANNSSYEVSFDAAANRYTLRHSGANTALNSLPPSPNHHPDDPPDQQITDFANLPQLGPAPRIEAIHRMTATPVKVTTVEFAPLGQTTRGEATIIWLSCGADDSLRHLPIRVDPISGLATVGQLQTAPPPVASSGA